MPVHFSSNTEAAPPHLPALAGGIPPAAHPAPCVHLTTLLVCSPLVCLWSLAYILLPNCGNPLFHSAWHTITHLFSTSFSSTLGWSYLWFGDRKPLWLAVFVLLMGHPCGSLTITSTVTADDFGRNRCRAIFWIWQPGEILSNVVEDRNVLRWNGIKQQFNINIQEYGSLNN